MERHCCLRKLSFKFCLMKIGLNWSRDPDIRFISLDWSKAVTVARKFLSSSQWDIMHFTCDNEILNSWNILWQSDGNWNRSCRHKICETGLIKVCDPGRIGSLLTINKIWSTSFNTDEWTNKQILYSTHVCTDTCGYEHGNYASSKTCIIIVIWKLPIRLGILPIWFVSYKKKSEW